MAWALLVVPVAFCAWTGWLLVSVATIRRSVELDVGVTTQLAQIDEALRAEANELRNGGRLDPGGASWRNLRARLDSSQLLLRADPDGYRAIAHEAEQLRLTTAELDTLHAASQARAGGDSGRRVDDRPLAIASSASDAAAAATRKMRTRLSVLSTKLGSRWTQLAIVAVVSIVLAIASTVLVLAYQRALKEGRRIMAELRGSLAEVKELRGILPICSYCKRIRDDQDSWHKVEAYVSKHSGAEFTHGICPSCYELHVAPQL